MKQGLSTKVSYMGPSDLSSGGNLMGNHQFSPEQQNAPYTLSDKFYDFSKWSNVILVSFITIIGLYGNLMSTKIFLSKSYPKFPLRVYLILLAISDLVVLLLHYIDFTFRSWINLTETYSSKINFVDKSIIFCKFIPYFRNVFRTISVYTLILMTLQRYIYLYFPLVRSRWCSIKAGKKILFTLIVLSLFFNTSSLILNNLEKHHVNGESFCTVRKEFIIYQFQIDILFVMFTILIPTIFILILSLSLFYKIKANAPKDFFKMCIWNNKPSTTDEIPTNTNARTMLVQYSSVKLVNNSNTNTNKTGFVKNENENNNNQHHNQIPNELNDDFCSISDLDQVNEEEQQLNMVENHQAIVKINKQSEENNKKKSETKKRCNSTSFSTIKSLNNNETKNKKLRKTSSEIQLNKEKSKKNGNNKIQNGNTRKLSLQFSQIGLNTEESEFDTTQNNLRSPLFQLNKQKQEGEINLNLNFVKTKTGRSVRTTYMLVLLSKWFIFLHFPYFICWIILHLHFDIHNKYVKDFVDVVIQNDSVKENYNTLNRWDSIVTKTKLLRSFVNLFEVLLLFNYSINFILFNLNGPMFRKKHKEIILGFFLKIFSIFTRKQN